MLRVDEGCDSSEHRFVTEAAFDVLEDANFFLDVVRPFGLPYRYGLPAFEASATGPIDTVMLRAPFVPALATHFPSFVVYQIESATAGLRQSTPST